MTVRPRLPPALLVLLALLASSCSDRSPSPGQASAPAAAQAKPGDVEGLVRFSGKPPPPSQVPIPMELTHVCGEIVELPRAAIGPDNGLAEVVVWIDGAHGPLDAAPPPPAIDQRGCAFHPRVVAAAQGAQLQVINSDPLLHNVHTAPGASKPFNMAMPITGMKVQMPLAPKAEVTRVTCDVHPWMVAVVRTFDHPFFAVTDERGHFSIRGAPPGKATLHLWHPFLGEQRAAVDIPEGGAARPQIDWARP